jgi:hypothetical protein
MRYREDYEVIKEFMLVANEAKRTLDENSDGTWIMTYWRLDPDEDAQKLLDSINAGKVKVIEDKKQLL